MDTRYREILPRAFESWPYPLLLLEDGPPPRVIYHNPAFAGLLDREDLEGALLSDLPHLGGCDLSDLAGLPAGERGYLKVKDRTFNVQRTAPAEGVSLLIFQDVSQEMRRIDLLEVEGERVSKISLEFEDVFEGIQEGAFLVRAHPDGSFRYVLVNRLYRDMFMIGSRDVRGLTARELLGDRMGAMVEANYRDCINSRSPITVAERFLLPNDQVRLLQTSLVPSFLDHAPSHIVGFIKDVTDERRAQEERDAAFRRYEAMFREHPAVMLLIDPESGQILDANPSALNFYGYRHEEITRMTIQDINQLPEEEVRRRSLLAAHGKQRYFLFPHRLRSGAVRLVDVFTAPVNIGESTALFSIIFDVTEREEAKRRLHQEKETLNTTLMSIADGVVATDTGGTITSINPSALKMAGIKEQDALGRPFSQVFSIIESKTLNERDPLGAAIRSGRIIPISDAVANTPGGKIHISGSASPVRNSLGEVTGAVAVLRDVGQEKQWRDKMLYMSYHDPLTKLPNRRFLEEEISRLEEEQVMPVSVIMADVNALKMTNDAFGHERGDALLINAAKVLKAACRRGDVVGRWGGDEFLILLVGANERGAEMAAQRIREMVRDSPLGDIPMSIALGWGTRSNPGQGILSAMKEAEEMMYRHKLIDGRDQRQMLLDRILSALSSRCHEDEDHRNRLKKICLAVGSAMNLSPREMEDLSLLTYYHDIGMIGIPPEVLRAEGPLTENQMEDIRRHPEVGYMIAQNVKEIVSVADLILLHHERYDGSGYPRGLKGDQIPIQCRIFALADAYEAMTSGRPYRRPLSHREALEEIASLKGIVFDPQVVEAFVSSLGN